MPNSTEAQRAKRLSVIKKYLESFESALTKKEEVSIKYVDNAAEIICNLYYRYADEVIRETIDSEIIQNFKIASNTELVVLLADPIVDEDPAKRKYYTSRLALYCAMRLIIEWNAADESKFNHLIVSDPDIKDFLDEHFKWLYLLNPAYYNPIFSNSQVWRLFYYLLKEKSKA